MTTMAAVILVLSVWLSARETCPHCRADLLFGNCINMPLTRQLSNIVSVIGDHVLDDTSV